MGEESLSGWNHHEHAPPQLKRESGGRRREGESRWVGWDRKEGDRNGKKKRNEGG